MTCFTLPLYCYLLGRSNYETSHPLQGEETGCFLSLVDAKHLAQTLVEGYYTMLSRECDSVVMALTNVASTHSFKVRLPITRGGQLSRSLEIEWHTACILQAYPPFQMKDLDPFITVVHAILNECL